MNVSEDQINNNQNFYTRLFRAGLRALGILVSALDEINSWPFKRETGYKLMCGRKSGPVINRVVRSRPEKIGIFVTTPVRTLDKGSISLFKLHGEMHRGWTPLGFLNVTVLQKHICSAAGKKLNEGNDR